eukprot:jgi/Galph1/4144/GphlegSOOS_G2826.1
MATEEMTPYELSSLCMQCGKQGITKCLVQDIPYFKQVILMSFDCPFCGNHNNEVMFLGYSAHTTNKRLVTSAATIEPQGMEWQLRVETEKDWYRQVWVSDYATIEIPAINLEIPPKKGRITTVEGILVEVMDNLESDQQERRQGDPSLAEKIQQFLDNQLIPLKQGKEPFLLKIIDPSGSSRIEWLVPLETYGMDRKADKRLVCHHFIRSKEQNEMLGLYANDTLHNENETIEGLPNNQNEEAIAKDEVVKLPCSCPCCGAPGENRIHSIDIPYFKQVVIIAFSCASCGYKTNQVQSGTNIEPKGRTLTLSVKNTEDLSRSVLKSETCTLSIPEIELKLESGTLGGKFTTVEGILRDIHQELLEANPFVLGDSANQEWKHNFQHFLQRLDALAEGKEPFTFIMDDPAGNSHIQNICAPEPDPQLTIEEYERTEAMNEKPVFEIKEETTVFEEHVAIYKRKVQFPNNQQHDFHVMGHPGSNFSSALVFPFHASTKTVTLLKEYHPGSNNLLYCFPAGLFDPKKHQTILDTAKAELNEEDKYARNRMYMFLAFDCKPVQDFDERDEEEYIEIISHVDIPSLHGLASSGQMSLASTCLAWLGIEKLKIIG